MAIFSRNLTSEILEEQSAGIITQKTSPLSVLEVGCGDGSISSNLATRFPNNSYFASDVSAEAISQAILCGNRAVNFIVSPGLDAWVNQKFDIVICDMAAISEKIAGLSEWYNGVSCRTGIDGLELVMPVIQNVKNILSPGGYFVMPVISLCDVTRQKTALQENFSLVEYSKKIDWPMPKGLLKQMKEHFVNIDSNYCHFEKRFGLVLASTCAATCRF